MIEFNTLHISSVLYTHKSIVRHEVHVFTYKCMHNVIVNVKRKKTRGKKALIKFYNKYTRTVFCMYYMYSFTVIISQT